MGAFRFRQPPRDSEGVNPLRPNHLAGAQEPASLLFPGMDGTVEQSGKLPGHSSQKRANQALHSDRGRD